jgi:hypothetical protein
MGNEDVKEEKTRKAGTQRETAELHTSEEGFLPRAWRGGEERMGKTYLMDGWIGVCQSLRCKSPA